MRNRGELIRWAGSVALAALLVACGGEEETADAPEGAGQPVAVQEVVVSTDAGDDPIDEALQDASGDREAAVAEGDVGLENTISHKAVPSGVNPKSRVLERRLEDAPTPAVIQLGQAASEAKRVLGAGSVKRGTDDEPREMQTGFGRRVTEPADADGGAKSAFSTLSWKSLSNGWRVAALGVNAGDAKGVRLGLHVGALPEMARIRFYGGGSDSMLEVGGKEVAGAVQAKAEVMHNAEGSGPALYWSPVIAGATGIVEVALPPGVGVGEVDISIAQIVHMVVTPEESYAKNTAKAAGDAGTCEIDAVCEIGATPGVADAVMLLDLISYDQFGLASSYACTSTLVADNAHSGIPYVLTADHCVPDAQAALDASAHVFFRSPSCNALPSETDVRSEQVAGTFHYLFSQTRAGGTDASLLRLQLWADLPEGALMAGWNAATVSSLPQVKAFHHAAADHLKFSEGRASYKSTNYLRVYWSRGVTEAGSSGSALLNDQDQIIGTLWGGGSSCAAPTKPDEFGRFSVAYAKGMRKWLNVPSQVLWAVGNFDGQVYGASTLMYRPITASASGQHMFAQLRVSPAASVVDQASWFDPGWNAYPAAPVLAVTDFDGDGRDDVIFRENLGDGLTRIGLLRQTVLQWTDDQSQPQEEVIREPVTLLDRVSAAVQFVGVGDLDGNGTADIVLRDTKLNLTKVFLSETDDASLSGFSMTPLPSLAMRTASGAIIKTLVPVGVGDFTGDAKAEILWRDSYRPTIAQFVHYDEASGFFTSSYGSLRKYPGKLLGLADVNGDGKSDFVFNYYGKVQYAHSEVSATDGTYAMSAPIVVIPKQSSAYTLAALKDLDADGKADMLWRHKTTGALLLTRSTDGTLPLATHSLALTQ